MSTVPLRIVFKGTVDVISSGGSLEIMSTVPLRIVFKGTVDIILVHNGKVSF